MKKKTRRGKRDRGKKTRKRRKTAVGIVSGIVEGTAMMVDMETVIVAPDVEVIPNVRAIREWSRLTSSTSSTNIFATKASARVMRKTGRDDSRNHSNNVSGADGDGGSGRADDTNGNSASGNDNSNEGDNVSDAAISNAGRADRLVRDAATDVPCEDLPASSADSKASFVKKTPAQKRKRLVGDEPSDLSARFCDIPQESQLRQQQQPQQKRRRRQLQREKPGSMTHADIVEMAVDCAKDSLPKTRHPVSRGSSGSIADTTNALHTKPPTPAPSRKRKRLDSQQTRDDSRDPLKGLRAKAVERRERCIMKREREIEATMTPEQRDIAKRIAAWSETPRAGNSATAITVFDGNAVPDTATAAATFVKNGKLTVAAKRVRRDDGNSDIDDIDVDDDDADCGNNGDEDDDECCGNAKRETKKPTKTMDAIVSAVPIVAVADDKCYICGEPQMLLSSDSSYFQCRGCRSRIPNLDATASAFAFGEEPDYSTGPPTKTHHFEDWLKELQPRESKNVDASVLQRVVQHCCEVQGVASGSDVYRYHVRNALRALGLSSLYPSEIWILCAISDVPPPTLTVGQDAVFRTMFAAIQVPYAKWKARLDPDRRNFFVYAHIIAKFCQILRWNRFLRILLLPRQRRALIILEAIFKGVCTDLKWEFIPLPDNMLYP